MVNVKKLRDLSVNGIFDKKGEATVEGYGKYRAWKEAFLCHLAAVEKVNQYHSSIKKDSPEYISILEYAKKDPEMSIELLTSQLTRGASWYTLSLIYDLTGFKNLPEYAGMFYSQVGAWLLYFDVLTGKSDV